LITIGLAAYDEEKSIGRILQRLLTEEYPENFEIIVVAGGTDDTIRIVKDYVKRFETVKLIEEKQRAGKPTAINEILHESQGRYIVLTDADVIPDFGSIKKLLEPFDTDSNIGATCGRVIPTNDRKSLFGFWAHFLYDTAHNQRQKDSINRKLFHLTGYLCAIRRGMLQQVPEDALADDAVIGAMIAQRGYKITYVPDARVYVKFPESFLDFLRQKRRTFAGFLQISDWFSIKTRSLTREVQEGLIQGLRYCTNARELFYYFLLCIFRALAWLWAFYDFRIYRKELKALWISVRSTKIW